MKNGSTAITVMALFLVLLLVASPAFGGEPKGGSGEQAQVRSGAANESAGETGEQAGDVTRDRTQTRSQDGTCDNECDGDQLKTQTQTRTQTRTSANPVWGRKTRLRPAHGRGRCFRQRSQARLQIQSLWMSRSWRRRRGHPRSPVDCWVTCSRP